MPSSAVRTFTDPDDYAAAIRQGTYELTVTEPGHFTAKLTRIDLHRLWMQRFSDNLPRISHIAGWGGRAVIAFRTEPGPSLLSSGIEMQPTNIVRYSEGQNYYRRSSGFAAYGSMSLPLAEMAAFGEALAAADLTPPRDAMVITPSPAAMARLQRLHAAAGDLAETAPEILANPEAARGLEQSLVELMVGCLSHQNARDNSLAQGQHAIIMRRFRRILEDNPEQPLYIPEICKAIRVPDRTLRQCCQEYLGMGPKHYFAAAPLASGAAGVAPGQVEYDKCHGNRHAVRILAARALRRRVPVPVRRAPIRHASPATRLTAGIRLPKLHSRPRGRTPKVEVLRSSPRR